MRSAERYGGPIDPYSPHSLYDVVNGDIPDPGRNEPCSIEYEGFHIMHQGGSRFLVQLDGHSGDVMRFSSDEYDDVLELVADLNDILIRAQEYESQGDKEALVEWAGRIMTSEAARAEENPDLYIHIPDPL